MITISTESQSVSTVCDENGYRYTASYTITKQGTAQVTTTQFRASVDILNSEEPVSVAKASVYNYDDYSNQQTNVRYNKDLTNEQVFAFSEKINSLKDSLYEYLVNGVALNQ